MGSRTVARALARVAFDAGSPLSPVRVAAVTPCYNAFHAAPQDELMDRSADAAAMTMTSPSLIVAVREIEVTS
jgi:hypothetical protein